jgi:deoxyribose-phosphate aldolase
MNTDQSYTPEALAKTIDQTILKADATVEEVARVVAEARQYKFASVCINTTHLKLVAEGLEGSGVLPCCVVGFPLGAMETEAKAAETERAVALGAKEVDMVINIGAAKGGDWALVRQDIAAVVKAAKGSAIVKVIIETCLLTDEEKVQACLTAKEAGADFVKTSTGFSTGGATTEDVRLMRETVGADRGVKASGGIRSYEDAVAMLKAGASRLGASSGIAIISGI